MDYFDGDQDTQDEVEQRLHVTGTNGTDEGDETGDQ